MGGCQCCAVSANMVFLFSLLFLIFKKNNNETNKTCQIPYDLIQLNPRSILQPAAPKLEKGGDSTPAKEKEDEDDTIFTNIHKSRRAKKNQRRFLSKHKNIRDERREKLLAQIKANKARKEAAKRTYPIGSVSNQMGFLLLSIFYVKCVCAPSSPFSLLTTCMCVLCTQISTNSFPNHSVI